MDHSSHVNPARVSKYRNWEALSEIKKKQIMNDLFRDNEMIQKEFALLSDKILHSFETQATKVSLLKYFIVAYGIPLPVKIRKATTLTDVMLVLRGSWFNIQLFQHCVSIFGSDDDQENMKVYETNYLIPYLQRSMFEIPSQSFASANNNTDLLSLFLILPDDAVPTGQDVVTIRYNLCKILEIREGILQFIRYSESSTILTFGMPQELRYVFILQSSYFIFDDLKRTYTFNNDLIAEILPSRSSGVIAKESTFHRSPITEAPGSPTKRYPSGIEATFQDYSSSCKTHPNGVKVAEVIDRDDSAFLMTTGDIAAIDFGTANCSLAYSTSKDKELTLLKLSAQEGQVRVPTIMLVNEKGEAVKFGKRAIREYDRLDPDMRKNYHLFERIKLALGPNEDISRETKITDINGNQFFLREVIALFLNHLKEELETCFQKLGIRLTAADFHWVITVPAIWSAPGKQMMREAAYQAGLCGTHSIKRIEVVSFSSNAHLQPLEVDHPEKLSLALEPESASFFCRAMGEQDINEFSNRQARIPLRDKYIVVDIGGGTADFSAHGLTSEGNVEVLTTPECHLSGGIAVNQEFEKFLANLVDDPGFITYLSDGDEMNQIENKLEIRNIVYEEFEEEKKEFGQIDMSRISNDGVFMIELSDSFYSFYKTRLEAGVHKLVAQKNDNRVTIGRRKMLCISYSKMEEFFHGPVSKIITILKGILEQLNNDVHTIFLVGGFGGCQYVYYRLHQELKSLYGSDKFRIIVPNYPHLAVVQGAIQYLKNPLNLVSSHVADRTYGIETTIPFDQKIHDFRYYLKPRSGERMCKHLFWPLVSKGEHVHSKKLKKMIFEAVDSSQTFVKFDLLTSDDKDPFYTRSPNGVLKHGVKVLATITVTLPTPNTDQGTGRDIYLLYDFSHAEIQVHAHDVSSNTECKVVFDIV